MKTRRTSNAMLKAATLVLVLGFMVTGASQASAKVVVRAKVGPVTVKVGQKGHNCGRSYRGCSHRPYRTRTVVVREPRSCRSEAVWVPGHWKVKWNGRRKWVPGHWRLI